MAALVLTRSSVCSVRTLSPVLSLKARLFSGTVPAGRPCHFCPPALCRCSPFPALALRPTCSCCSHFHHLPGRCQLSPLAAWSASCSPVPPLLAPPSLLLCCSAALHVISSARDAAQAHPGTPHMQMKACVFTNHSLASGLC